MRKSFLSVGSEAADLTFLRSSGLPSKKFRSVSTEIAAAPPSSYFRAYSAGSTFSLILPFDGEARFISAITFIPSGPGPASRSIKALLPFGFSASRRRTRSGVCFAAALTSSFLRSRIFERKSDTFNPLTKLRKAYGQFQCRAWSAVNAYSPVNRTSASSFSVALPSSMEA